VRGGPYALTAADGWTCLRCGQQLLTPADAIGVDLPDLERTADNHNCPGETP
jgi:hypothetical protein